MANYGIKVGSNTTTNTDKELNLTSEYSSLKLYKWGDTQFTTDGSGEGSVEITHNLGYVPIVIAFKKFTAQFTFLSATTYPNSFRLINNYNAYDDDDYFDSSTTSTKLKISTTTATADTTYYFRYYILVDLSQAFSSASSISLTNNFGFKISKPDKNVSTAEEYDMAYSSKYKALQYYENHIESSSLTLPAMWSNAYDTEVNEATYVDFNHNLGYQPFFLVYSDLATAYLYEMPYLKKAVYGISSDGLDSVSAWCDSSRVRVIFYRQSLYPGGEVYAAKTISIKVIIFAEDLTGSASP